MLVFRLITALLVVAAVCPLFGQPTVTVVTPKDGQPTVIVRPKEIDDVLINPGIGFMTFQRFNGDELNSGLRWTEGFPIAYQDFKGSLKNKNHPDTSIAYFRVYWRYIEPEMGKYRWDLFDEALKTAHNRGQTLMIRIAPYGSSGDAKDDVPDWYRKMVGTYEDPLPGKGWRVDPEDPRYAKYFGGMVREFGKRYDGLADLESVDLSILGYWGEGRGSNILSHQTRAALVDAYLESFDKTPLVMLLTDETTNKYGLSKKAVGWRVDCLGDMPRRDGPPRADWGSFPGWSHMMDYYPEGIVNFGVRDAWEKAPVSFEICGVMQGWKNNGYDVDYIIDQSLKWHISSFNAKSSPVPEEWGPQVNRWLNRMGYRFVLRKFTYPASVAPLGKLAFTTWWENKGVAPCYRQYPLALRLKNSSGATVLRTDADIRTWLPGDAVYDNAVFIPADQRAGEYEFGVALLDPDTGQPKVKLAIGGREPDGWYTLGKIRIGE